MAKRTEVPSRVPSLSDQLAALIRESGQSPAAIAVESKIAPSVLSRFLSGERGVSLETATRIGAALGGLRLERVSRRGTGRTTSQGGPSPGPTAGRGGEGISEYPPAS